MKVNDSVLHLVYHHSKENKGKSPRLSPISLYSVRKSGTRVTLLCVFRCLQKVSLKNTFLLSIFCLVFGSVGTFWLYGEFDGKYPKEPVSVTKKDTSDPIYQSIYISLWFCDLGLGCTNSSKMATFRPTTRILWHNAFLLGLFTLKILSPDNVLQHIWKPKRVRYHPKWEEQFLNVTNVKYDSHGRSPTKPVAKGIWPNRI